MAGKHRGKGEGSVYPVHDAAGRVSHWEAKITLPDGRRRKRRAPSYAAAKLAIAELKGEAARDRPDRDRLTVGAFLAEWLLVTAPDRSAVTQARHERSIRCHLAPALGGLRLAKLAPADVARLRRDLLRDHAPGSVRTILATLGAALADAVRWELLDRNPVRAIKLPPQGRAAVRPMDPAEALAILAAMRGWRYEAAVVVALGLGLRQGEVLGLRWEDLELDAGVVRVERQLGRAPVALRGAGAGPRELRPPKARSARVLPLSASLVALLRGWASVQAAERARAGAGWQESGHVFTAPSGATLAHNTVAYVLRSRLAAAGLPPRTVHGLRHGYAALELRAGTAPRVVMESMGHRSLAMTMLTYTEVAPDLLRDAAERMDALLGEALRGELLSGPLSGLSDAGDEPADAVR